MLIDIIVAIITGSAIILAAVLPIILLRKKNLTVDVDNSNIDEEMEEATFVNMPKQVENTSYEDISKQNHEDFEEEIDFGKAVRNNSPFNDKIEISKYEQK